MKLHLWFCRATNQVRKSPKKTSGSGVTLAYRMHTYHYQKWKSIKLETNQLKLQKHQPRLNIALVNHYHVCRFEMFRMRLNPSTQFLLFVLVNNYPVVKCLATLCPARRSKTRVKIEQSSSMARRKKKQKISKSKRAVWFSLFSARYNAKCKWLHGYLKVRPMVRRLSRPMKTVFTIIIDCRAIIMVCSWQIPKEKWLRGYLFYRIKSVSLLSRVASCSRSFHRSIVYF